MIKLVAFDWNGTLLADSIAVIEGTNKELEVLGMLPITLETYRRYYDTPIMEFYKNLGVDPKVFTAKSEEIAQAFHSHYEPRVAKARTRAGTRHVLAYLHSKNIKRAVVSNHTSEGIYLQLERLKLLSYFDTVLANGSINGSHFIGKEERLKNHMTENKLAPPEVVIVGDTVEEIRIGKNLGIRSVSITGGYNTTERLQAAKPDIIINSLTKLASVLEEL